MGGMFIRSEYQYKAINVYNAQISSLERNV